MKRRDSMTKRDNIGLIVAVESDNHVRRDGMLSLVWRGIAHEIIRALGGIVGVMRRRHERNRSRLALERLNEQQLRDVGLTRVQAVREYRKSRYIG